ncbi:lytic polysaccharide monooxygenase [Colwellia sp. MB3u-28]|nr:lytic polysaccharide monooxygenase [Colwellia sp. MB02u-7]MBA6237141.1 lytic polysaccharide monooxygenase [Colwellia sp. MB02u-11]MBA6257427.1 lytic polysaccharide monooxygenase [Colwellia sp. MB3u-28]MBA6260499.1 lytic polysaccharide monooxygenase [Colwellia sp. MB3u-41]MBA6301595.1 lytic polysaccharide monooxygenase [Colwellia sp. MB3u-22]MBA6311481.1 lytic polysaccharide monooxygenase [Colwellia sp. MB3u-64]
MLTVSSKSQAHAFMDNPKARQSICQAQGGFWWPADGSNIPNLACRAAFLDSGYVQFIQEHEISVNVADYHNQQAIEAAIPDGTLCGAGSAEKSGVNLASPYWQKTEVMPNGDNNIQVRFNAQTPHNPSFWRIYLSKPNFNASTDILRWQDLELVQEHGNIDFTKSSDGNRYYNMDVHIPADRVGDALLYSHWQRVDVVGEGFYNCSDITIVRDDVEPDEWQAIAYFIKQGQNANVGDSPWARLFNADGQELLNQQFLVNGNNAETWQEDFAAQLNESYNQHIKIGVKNLSNSSSNNDIIFDRENILSNQVWVTNSNYSFTLSVIAQTENTAPIVHDITDFSLDEQSETSMHVHAFDDQNDPLTFDWTVPAPLTFSGENADITITAADVDSEQTRQVSVAVSDGKLTTTQLFNVTVNNLTDLPNIAKWLSSQAYSTGDKVSYQNKTYQAKWWNKNQQPSSSNTWNEVVLDNDDGPLWNIETSYPGGSNVTHNNNLYQSKWWTKGDEPNLSEVWEKR